MTKLVYEPLANGSPAIWLATNPSRLVLRGLADIVVHELGAEQIETFDGGDLLFWDFALGPERFTLHSDRSRGIAVVAANSAPPSQVILRRVAEHLAPRVPSVEGALG